MTISTTFEGLLQLETGYFIYQIWHRVGDCQSVTQCETDKTGVHPVSENIQKFSILESNWS